MDAVIYDQNGLMENTIKELMVGRNPDYENNAPKARSILIIGGSSAGKTTFVREIANAFQKVFKHHEKTGNPYKNVIAGARYNYSNESLDEEWEEFFSIEVFEDIDIYGIDKMIFSLTVGRSLPHTRDTLSVFTATNVNVVPSYVLGGVDLFVTIGDVSVYAATEPGLREFFSKKYPELPTDKIFDHAREFDAFRDCKTIFAIDAKYRSIARTILDC